LRTLPFSLPGFEIQQITAGETTITIIAHANSLTATCPSCQQVSHRIHSYYTRSPADQRSTDSVGPACSPLSLFESAVFPADVCGADSRSGTTSGKTNNSAAIPDQLPTSSPTSLCYGRCPMTYYHPSSRAGQHLRKSKPLRYDTSSG
jgi:hypothetical protein